MKKTDREPRKGTVRSMDRPSGSHRKTAAERGAPPPGRELRLWHRVIHPVTRHFRSARGRHLRRLFPSPFLDGAKICDIGGSRHFWDEVGLDIPPENITIFNVSAGETETVGQSRYSTIPVLIYDGRRIPARDREYDLVVCNSVLEHVPPEARPQLSREMLRVGKNLFLQTPAYTFPLDPHFLLPLIHWVPKGLGYPLAKVSPWKILSRAGDEVVREYFFGTSLLREREVEALFPAARIEYERFMGLKKSFLVIGTSP